MMADDLKPCPFCGAEDANALRVMARTYRAGCRSCGAHVLGDTMAEAIAAWNRRAPDPALQARVESLEGERDGLSAALSWIEPPFVDATTPADEILRRVKFAVADAKAARAAPTGASS